MPEQPVVVTARLELVPCSLSVATALHDDVEEGGHLLDARLPQDWPDSELAEFLPLYARLLREDPQLLGFGVWLLIERESRIVVGSAGFQGPRAPRGRSSSAMGCIPTSGTVATPPRQQERSWHGLSSNRAWRASSLTASKTTSPPTASWRRQASPGAESRRTDAFASRQADRLGLLRPPGTQPSGGGSVSWCSHSDLSSAYSTSPCSSPSILSGQGW